MPKTQCLTPFLMLWVLIHFPTHGELKVIKQFSNARECNLETLLYPGSICTPTKQAPKAKVYY